ncbi:MAG: membrane protein of unknown function [Promethearchaeota archaeon]|nr:MAG: membrane protein of unknown function [Candidatus Lokiarchaeota archaeon]
MAVEPYSFEFNLFLILTIILLIAKLLLSFYLGFKVYRRSKERGEFKLDFMASVLMLVISLLVSRILYTIFDFQLTVFNPDLYYVSPNVEVWKIAGLVATLGSSTVLYVIDKRILKFRFKGIIAYIFIIISLIRFFLPINSKADFTLNSTIGSIAQLAFLIIPVVFISLGWKIPDLRRNAFLVAFGIIIYIFGSIIVSEFILSPIREIFGDGGQILVFFIFLISKISGLTMASYGVTKFTR